MLLSCLRTLILPLTAALAIAGCTAQAQSKPVIELSDLNQSSTTSAGLWESAPMVRSLWIDLSGASTVKVAHALGHKPSLVLPYLSFVEDDRKTTDKRTSFLGAGDVANIRIDDDQYVIVENRTQGHFYLRLVLQ